MPGSLTLPSVRGLLCSLALCAPALAGPLNPPSGPIAPTARFGERIELSQETAQGNVANVFRILQPGSYFLAEDLTVPSGMNGIRVQVSDVTIDLNGYTIRGEPGSNEGIIILRPIENTTIRNGVIRDMGQSAILGGVFGLEVDRCFIEGVHAFNNGLWGFLTGEFCTFRNCVVDTAGLQGIRTGRGALIENCVVRNTTDGDGFDVGPSSRISGCVAESVLYEGSAVAQGDGFRVGSESVVTGCLSVSTSEDGFELGNRCLVSGCATFLNEGLGYRLGESSRIEDSTASDVLGSGITVDERSAVLRCSVARAFGQGIALGSSCTAIGNMVVECTGAGFTGLIAPGGASGCVIDSNVLIRNNNNLQVFATGCTVTRNMSYAPVLLGININAGNFAGAVVANPAAAGPWDNIAN